MARSQVPVDIGSRRRRQAPGNVDANHHLWRNGHLWWVAFTVHLPGWQKERVRLSLGTADLGEARRLRDDLLRRYPETRNCELSLRLGAPRTRRRRGAAAERRPFAA